MSLNKAIYPALNRPSFQRSQLQADCLNLPSKDCVLCLPFALNAKDMSIYHNDGTIYGAAWVTGKCGQALSFNGLNNYVEVLNNNSLNTVNAITLEAWINLAAYDSSLVSHILRKNNAYTFGVGATGKIGFYRYNGGAANGSWTIGATTIPSNQWHQVVAVYDSVTGAKVYLDGVLDGTLPTLTGTIDSSTNNLWIGMMQGVSLYQFNGVIDEVRIYSRALSAAEIQADSQNSPGFSSNLLAKVPAGTTDFIATLSWQGTGNINVTIQSPSQNYTEAMVHVYQKTTYSASSGTSTMLNIKRLEVSIGPLASDQNWYIILVTNNVQDYKITVEVQT